MFLLGCSARQNDGIAITKNSSPVRLEVSKKYGSLDTPAKVKITEITDSRTLISVFIKNSDEDF